MKGMDYQFAMRTYQNNIEQEKSKKSNAEVSEGYLMR